MTMGEDEDCMNENPDAEWRKERNGILNLCNDNENGQVFPIEHKDLDQNHQGDDEDSIDSSDSSLSDYHSDEYAIRNNFLISHPTNTKINSSVWFQQLQCFSNFFQSISDVLNMDTTFYSSITPPTNQLHSHVGFHLKNHQHYIEDVSTDDSIEEKDSFKNEDQDEVSMRESFDDQNDISDKENEDEVTISFVQPKSLEESLMEEKKKVTKEKKKDRATLLKEWKEQKQKQKQQTQDSNKVPSKKAKPKTPSKARRKLPPKTPQPRKHSDDVYQDENRDSNLATISKPTNDSDQDNIDRIVAAASTNIRMSVSPKPRKMKRYSSTHKRKKDVSSRQQSGKDDLPHKEEQSPPSFYFHPSSMFFSFLAKTIGTYDVEKDKDISKDQNQQNNIPTEREKTSLAMAKKMKSQYTALNQTLTATKNDLNKACTQNYQLQIQLRERQEQLFNLEKQHSKTLNLVKEQTSMEAQYNAIQLEKINLKKQEISLRKEMKLQYDSEIRNLQLQARIMKHKLMARNKVGDNDDNNDIIQSLEQNNANDKKDSDEMNNQIMEIDNIIGEEDTMVSFPIVDNCRNSSKETEQSLMTTSKDPYVLRALLEDREETIIELRSQLLAAEQLRRSMHNQIQELRGNIRVYVRVRPFLSIVDNGNDDAYINETHSLRNNDSINFNDNAVADETATSVSMDLVQEIEHKTPIEIANNNLDDNYPTVISLRQRNHKKIIDNKDKLDSIMHKFNFDRVFEPSASQDQIFDEVTDFVQSAMDGYNVCLFSYGQTGSGKTYTMEGFGTGPMRGIIPRAVEQILIEANKCEKKNDTVISSEHDNSDLKEDHVIPSSSIQNRNTAWEYELHASFLEIYNESLKDLLVNYNDDGDSNIGDVASITNKNETKSESNNCNNKDDSSVTSGDSETNRKKLMRTTTNKHGAVNAQRRLIIRKHDSGKKKGRKTTYVEGLSRVLIDTKTISHGMNQLNSIIETASSARSVASTKMNSQSSRSHSIFILNIKGINKETGTTVSGSLNLCDLAGSERLSRTLHNNNDSGSSLPTKSPLKPSKNVPNKTLLKETQSINRSLSALGDVFSALATNASHVPYRNTKLTYLLQDCLSGNGKSIMFVNLSPTIDSCDESLCSLRFAQRVSQVELGKAVTHRQTRRTNSS